MRSETATDDVRPLVQPVDGAWVDPLDPRTVAPATPAPRIGYVLKMYPRFSETFVLQEMLARESAGEQLEVFSLRLPVDGHFHAELARLQAPVSYLPQGRTASEVWQAVATAHREGVLARASAAAQAELFAAEPGVAVQALALARAVHARGLTHLHAHFASLATSVTRLASLLTGVPYSFTTHAKDIFHSDVAEDDLARKLADARAVITISDHNDEDLRRRHPRAAAVLHRVRNGIDLDAFAFTPAAGRREEIVAVGRLVEKKGFDTLLDAVALLRGRGDTTPLTLIGSGPLAEPLAAQVEALGLTGVRLLGPMPQDEVRRRVARATVFAAPCRVGADGNRDGMPTVLLEAMALGTPCVATPVTGIPEAVQHGRTGLLVPPDAPDALARALRAVLDDPALRQRLALAARGRMEADYDVRQQAARMSRITVGTPAGTTVPEAGGSTTHRTTTAAGGPR